MEGVRVCVCVFVFKQKTADELRLSLVGSEMCVRDRGRGASSARCCDSSDRTAAAPFDSGAQAA